MVIVHPKMNLASAGDREPERWRGRTRCCTYGHATRHSLCGDVEREEEREETRARNGTGQVGSHYPLKKALFREGPPPTQPPLLPFQALRHVPTEAHQVATSPFARTKRGRDPIRMQSTRVGRMGVWGRPCVIDPGVHVCPGR